MAGLLRAAAEVAIAMAIASRVGQVEGGWGPLQQKVGEQVGDSQGQVQWQPSSRLGAAEGQVWGKGS